MPDFRAFTLYVVRHGECEHNAAGWAAGHDDSPLTERGRGHARANGRALAEMADLAALDFFASSLHRACCTMELLREAAGLPATGYHADRRLMEGDIGDHSRLPATDMLRYPNESPDMWEYVHPDGESVAQVHARVGRFLKTLKRDSVLVSHALTSSMIRAHYLNLSPEEALRYHMPNAGLLRLSMGTETLFGE
ncbi:MAG TPA: histidine phosphatase family protein [Rhizomicrobium sp.]|nr:histidine phosphatase family protein [Rhizomicrobium sp.]